MLEEFREGMIGTQTREAFMAGGDLEADHRNPRHE